MKACTEAATSLEKTARQRAWQAEPPAPPRKTQDFRIGNRQLSFQEASARRVRKSADTAMAAYLQE